MLSEKQTAFIANIRSKFFLKKSYGFRQVRHYVKDLINFAKTAQLHTFGMKTKCPVGAMLGGNVVACRVNAQKR